MYFYLRQSLRSRSFYFRKFACIGNFSGNLYSENWPTSAILTENIYWNSVNFWEKQYLFLGLNRGTWAADVKDIFGLHLCITWSEAYSFMPGNGLFCGWCQAAPTPFNRCFPKARAFAYWRPRFLRHRPRHQGIGGLHQCDQMWTIITNSDQLWQIRSEVMDNRDNRSPEVYIGHCPLVLFMQWVISTPIVREMLCSSDRDNHWKYRNSSSTRKLTDFCVLLAALQEYGSHCRASCGLWGNILGHF